MHLKFDMYMYHCACSRSVLDNNVECCFNGCKSCSFTKYNVQHAMRIHINLLLIGLYLSVHGGCTIHMVVAPLSQDYNIIYFVNLVTNIVNVGYIIISCNIKCLILYMCTQHYR